jgi:hypothetical protein
VVDGKLTVSMVLSSAAFADSTGAIIIDDSIEHAMNITIVTREFGLRSLVIVWVVVNLVISFPLIQATEQALPMRVQTSVGISSHYTYRIFSYT